MCYTTLCEGMMQFFTCPLQLLKKKVLCLQLGIESFMLYKIVTAVTVMQQSDMATTRWASEIHSSLKSD